MYDTRSVYSVDQVDVRKVWINSPVEIGPRLFIFAKGTVNSSGWSHASLDERYYAVPPADGIWEIDFNAIAPIHPSLQVMLPITASTILDYPEWIRGIRIISATNSLEDRELREQALENSPDVAPELEFEDDFLELRRAILERQIAVFDDSIQPIGFCSGIGRIKMKKLRHTLTLVIDGPSQSAMRRCFQRAAAAGLIAAIVAVYATGGGALSAAISAFVSALRDCLGDQYNVRIRRSSHWIEWCT